MQIRILFLSAAFLLLLSACDIQTDEQAEISPPPPVSMERTGYLSAKKLDETSGMQASYAHGGDLFVHNDDGKPRIYVIDQSGKDLGKLAVKLAKNKDWEDITSVPVGAERWLVAGDIGDNFAKRKHITLYFVEEPQRDEDGSYSGRLDVEHKLELTYPDGPRDCEAMSYDPLGKQILFLTKRDKPSHIYAVDLQTALNEDEAELEFLGTLTVLRPPTISDRAKWGGRTEWISQPTGFDISPDGTEAAIITYRSLYRYRREADEDWLTALQRKPEEVVGPPAKQNEAVTYSTDGNSIFVVTEKQPAPIYRFNFKQ